MSVDHQFSWLSEGFELHPHEVRFSEAVEIACRLCREKGIAEKDQDDVASQAHLALLS